MQKLVFSLFLILLLVISLASSVHAVADRKRKPRRRSSSSSSSSVDPDGDKRDQAIIFLRRTLNVILESNKLELSKVIGKEQKHDLVKKARFEMFQALDDFMISHCSEERTDSAKKTAIMRAWRALNEYLFMSEKLDFHNGCLNSDVVFPSVIYD